MDRRKVKGKGVKNNFFCIFTHTICECAAKVCCTEKYKECEKMKHFPKEQLICAKNGPHYKWYTSDGTHCTYLSKKNRHIAEQLALKKLLTLQLEDAINEKHAILAYLSTRENSNSPEQFFTNHPEFQNLLSTMYPSVSDALLQWSKEPFEQNTNHPDGLIHQSVSGQKLRSKSEVFIDTALCANGIPFRYECALHLADLTLFPDFTIRHPRTGATYYWEHFGLMDDPSYAKNACAKLQTYTHYGIIPTIQLITTYETREHPLTLETVDKIIDEYFL